MKYMSGMQINREYEDFYLSSFPSFNSAFQNDDCSSLLF